MTPRRTPGWMALMAGAALIAVPVAQAGEGSATVKAGAGRPSAPLLRPYIGKPTPPIRVRAVPVGELHSGRPGRLRLEVTAGSGIESATLNIVSDQYLEMIISGPVEIRQLGRGERHSVEIEVTPTSGGQRRLAGLVEFVVGGQRQAMPVTLDVPVAGPVTAIPARSKPEREPLRDATGEWVYPLPSD